MGSFHAPPLTKDFQQFWGERDIAIFQSLTLLHADDHAAAINVGGLESHGFGEAQAGGIAGGQDGAMFTLGEATQKLQDLLDAEDLTQTKKLAPETIVGAVSALRFLYKVTLRREWKMEDIIPTPKKPQRLPIIWARMRFVLIRST